MGKDIEKEKERDRERGTREAENIGNASPVETKNLLICKLKRFQKPESFIIQNLTLTNESQASFKIQESYFLFHSLQDTETISKNERQNSRLNKHSFKYNKTQNKIFDKINKEIPNT